MTHLGWVAGVNCNSNTKQIPFGDNNKKGKRWRCLVVGVCDGVQVGYV